MLSPLASPIGYIDTSPPNAVGDVAWLLFIAVILLFSLMFLVKSCRALIRHQYSNLLFGLIVTIALVAAVIVTTVMYMNFELAAPYAFATGLLMVVRAVIFGGALLIGTIWGIKEFR